MDKSIIDICVFHHSPRFKPWAMKTEQSTKPFQRFNNKTKQKKRYATFIQ